MANKVQRGVGICHYNRLDKLPEILKAITETVPENTRVVVADDGSDREKFTADNGGTEYGTSVEEVCKDAGVLLIKGPNAGVAANKNRALWVLQDCQFIALIEDDLKPIQKGWFECYEQAAAISGIHHFCRVQDKKVPESVESFSAFLARHHLTPLYASSPRGDFTFLTSTVLHRVGGFNPAFRGAGYAHGEWSGRVARAGLIGHPLKWIDIMQGRDRFVQVGDTSGGRWKLTEEQLKAQLSRNKRVFRDLEKSGYVNCPLVLE